MVGCSQLVITKAVWFLWLLLCLCSWFYRRIWLLRLPGASEDLPSSTTAHVHVSTSVLAWYSHLYIDIADVFHQKPTVRDLKRMKKMLIYAKPSVKFVYKHRRACKEMRKKGSKERKVGLNQTEDEMILGSIIVPKDHNSEGHLVDCAPNLSLFFTKQTTIPGSSAYVSVMAITKASHWEYPVQNILNLVMWLFLTP